MAKKQIKKLKVGENEFLGIELIEGDFLLETGRIMSKAYIKDISTTRLKPEIKQVFYDMYNVVIEMKKQEKIQSEAYIKIRKAHDDLRKMPSMLQKAKGLLTFDEFVAVFEKALTPKIRAEINHYGYEFNSPDGIPYWDNAIHISRRENIKKYYNGYLVFQEYDGVYMMRDNADKTKEGKEYIRKYSRPLSTKQNLLESLSLGNKNMLYYTACYEILIKKPMTEKYAKELADKFV